MRGSSKFGSLGSGTELRAAGAGRDGVPADLAVAMVAAIGAERGWTRTETRRDRQRDVTKSRIGTMNATRPSSADRPRREIDVDARVAQSACTLRSCGRAGAPADQTARRARAARRPPYPFIGRLLRSPRSSVIQAFNAASVKKVSVPAGRVSSARRLGRRPRLILVTRLRLPGGTIAVP